MHLTNSPSLLWLGTFFASLLVVCQVTAKLFGDFLVKSVGIAHLSFLKEDLHHF